ncbi:MAG: acyl-[acyl-carrier-protein]--UDP-N-acetylglucosamine O-acyltransferase [Micavibrio sp.]|mgnify:FL=1|nr:acyl-[acyl-carrier-protein]--UDP-N-acetylglucosamine O-acyltransferase [Micavibrio sp.]
MSDSNIHPTAVVDPDTNIGANVKIGPYCVIGKGAVLGDNVVLKNHVSIEGKVTLGAGTLVSPFASFGPPQDLKFGGENSELIIGENCRIFEHVTMNTGTEKGGMVTRVGDNGHFMVGVHIAHDCQVGNNVIMANNATLAGHVQVGNHVVIGGLAAVHQFIRIGDFAVIGGLSGIDADIIPYGRAKGERANLAGLNLIGLERSGFSKDEVRKMQKAYKSLFSSEGTFEDRIKTLEEQAEEDPHISKIVEFARAKKRFPLCQPRKSAA